MIFPFNNTNFKADGGDSRVTHIKNIINSKVNIISLYFTFIEAVREIVIAVIPATIVVLI